MEINREIIAENLSKIHLKIEKADYDQRVSDILKDYRKKARIDGFRPGNAPLGMINKLYRIPVLMEEVSKILNDALFNFIKDEQVKVIGEPMPDPDFATKFDPATDEDFEFVFEVGITPEIDFEITAKDKFTRYRIKIDKEMQQNTVDNILNRYGSMVKQEESDGKSVIVANISEADANGIILEGGILRKNIRLYTYIIKDEKQLAHFLNRKPGESFNVNLKECIDSEVDLTSMLEIDKETLATINGNFTFSVTEIEKFEQAEINQVLFDRAFGTGVVNSEEEFMNKVDEIIRAEMNVGTDHYLNNEIKKYYLDKYKKQLPEEFIKRWLKTQKKETTDEQLENEFPDLLNFLKWQFIKNHFADSYQISYSHEELKTFALDSVQEHFSQNYGYLRLSEEQLDHYAENHLNNEEQRTKLANILIESKIYAFIKETAKIEEKEISVEKFNKLLEK